MQIEGFNQHIGRQITGAIGADEGIVVLQIPQDDAVIAAARAQAIVLGYFAVDCGQRFGILVRLRVGVQLKRAAPVGMLAVILEEFHCDVLIGALRMQHEPGQRAIVLFMYALYHISP